MKESESCLAVSDSLQPHRLYSPWNSPGQNTGVGSLSLLQGIFPTQGSNPGLQRRSPTLQEDSLPAEPPGKPKKMEWVAYAFSSGSSWPRNWTGVSCIAGGLFTSWATREAKSINIDTENPLAAQWWGPGAFIAEAWLQSLLREGTQVLQAARPGQK